MKAFVIATVVSSLSVPLGAQWIDHPTPGIARAVQLLAAADLDLRGETALSGELVLEVLVARLSKLVRRSRG